MEVTLGCGILQRQAAFMYAGRVGANSVGSVLQEQEKVFVKESESIPARNYFWVIVHAHGYTHTHCGIV